MQRGGPGFFRDESRVIPHNLMLNLAQTAGNPDPDRAPEPGETTNEPTEQE